MVEREADFAVQTGQNVFFGLGSYGKDEKNAGLCYRMSVFGIDRDLIVQIISTGGSGAGEGV